MVMHHSCWCQVEALKKNGPSESLYAKTTETLVSIQKRLPCGSTWTAIQLQRLRWLIRVMTLKFLQLWDKIWCSVLGLCIPVIIGISVVLILFYISLQ
ncbi:hypothetical protein P3S67_024368 [Capsicum chacoense]